jgi:hypothetical protein
MYSIAAIGYSARIAGGGQIQVEQGAKKKDMYKIAFGMGAYIVDGEYVLDSCEVTFHNVSNDAIDKYKFVGETILEMNFYGDGSVANCRVSGDLENNDGYVVDDSCYMWIRVQDSGEPAWWDNIRLQLLDAGDYNYDSLNDFPGESTDYGTARHITATGNLQVECFNEDILIP